LTLPKAWRHKFTTFEGLKFDHFLTVERHFFRRSSFYKWLRGWKSIRRDIEPAIQNVSSTTLAENNATDRFCRRRWTVLDIVLTRRGGPNAGGQRSPKHTRIHLRIPKSGIREGATSQAGEPADADPVAPDWKNARKAPKARRVPPGWRGNTGWESGATGGRFSAGGGRTTPAKLVFFVLYFMDTIYTWSFQMQANIVFSTFHTSYPRQNHRERLFNSIARASRKLICNIFKPQTDHSPLLRHR